jgi:chloramphenicol O-acetyltransferase type A
MRIIDQSNWTRHRHFAYFRHWDYPHFNMCANVDLTAFLPTVKHSGASFTIGIVYLITRAANAIPEFRQRIRKDQVVEHEVVHPSATILVDDDLFSFCAFEYREHFRLFAADAQERIEAVRKDPWIADDSDQDWQLFMSAIPWVSFTSFMHPLNFPVDSIPRFAWGKYFREGDRVKMPLNVQGHHALMDGLHMGRYYQRLQEDLDRAGSILEVG